MDSDSEKDEACIFCETEYSDLKATLHSALYSKHANSQNYYYTREVNEIVEQYDEESCPTAAIARFNQFQYIDDDEHQNLKRVYGLEEYQGKIVMLGEYYKYHSDLPRFYGLPIECTMAKYANKKRDYEYRRIKKILRHQGQPQEETQISETMQSYMQHTSFEQKSRYSTMLHGVSSYPFSPARDEQRARGDPQARDDHEDSLQGLQQTLTRIVSQREHALPRLKLEGWAEQQDNAANLFEKLIAKNRIKNSLKQNNRKANFSKQPQANRFKKKVNPHRDEDRTIKLASVKKNKNSHNNHNNDSKQETVRNTSNIASTLRDKININVLNKGAKASKEHSSQQPLPSHIGSNIPSSHASQKPANLKQSREFVYNTNINIEIKNALICQNKELRQQANVPKSWNSAQSTALNPLLNKRLNALNQISLKPMLHDILRIGVSRHSQQINPALSSREFEGSKVLNQSGKQTNSIKLVMQSTSKLPTLNTLFRDVTGAASNSAVRTKEIEKIYGVENTNDRAPSSSRRGRTTSTAEKSQKPQITSRSNHRTELPTVRSQRSVASVKTRQHSIRNHDSRHLPEANSNKQTLADKRYTSTCTVKSKKAGPSKQASMSNIRQVKKQQQQQRNRIVSNQPNRNSVRNRMKSLQ